MLQIIDHFSTFVPELDPVSTGLTDFLTDSTADIIQTEDKSVHVRINSTDPDDLKEDTLAFRSYN